MRFLPLFLLLTGCAGSSGIYVGGDLTVQVSTAVGPDCHASRGLQRSADGQVQADANVLTQSGDALATGALAALLSSDVGCQ